MNILTSTLRAFKSRANFVTRSTLPITNNILIGGGQITRHAVNTFYAEEHAELDFPPFLIDSDQLGNVLANTHEDALTFMPQRGKVTINAGKMVMQFCSPPPEHYPSLPTLSEPSPLPTEQLALTRGFFNTDENGHPACKHIMLSPDGVAAFDGHIGISYHFTNGDEYPTAALPKEISQVLRGVQEAEYLSNDTYHAIRTGSGTMGFAKTEMTYQERVLGFFKVPFDIEEFRVDKKEWIDFNSLAISATPDPTKPARFSFTDGDLHLLFQASEYEVYLNDIISGTGRQNRPWFGYNPAKMNRVLQAIPDDTVHLYAGKNNYWITGESEYICNIMRYGE